MPNTLPLFSQSPVPQSPVSLPQATHSRRGSLSAFDPSESFTSHAHTRHRPSFASSFTLNSPTFPLTTQPEKGDDEQVTKQSLEEKKAFIIQFSRCLMALGAPCHRLESQLATTSDILGVTAQFAHLPSILIISFEDETQFIKDTSNGLILGKLHKVHEVYKKVVHFEMAVVLGTQSLKDIMQQKNEYSRYIQVAIAFSTGALIAPLAFGGSFVDMWVAGALSALLSFLQLFVARNNAMYSNVFEISTTIIISFTARALSTTGLFCYSAVASSGVVNVLPGYIILCGSLELASKNIVAGSVKITYSIIYALFLGFGIAIGSDLFFLVDPASKETYGNELLDNTFSLAGTFLAGNNTGNVQIFESLQGTFLFSNGTESDLKKGNISCDRDVDAPWYLSNFNPYLQILLVPLFSLLVSMSNFQPLKSRQMPVMIFISSAGWLCNTVANWYIFDRSDVVSAIGAFVIGVLGNMYSRIFHGTAFTSMVTGVLFLVPSGISAAGGLAMTYQSAQGDSYSQGLIIGFRMVQVAIGITVGLFMSGMFVYSFGKKKHAALFAF